MSNDHPHAVLEVDLKAVATNWQALCRLHPSGAVAGVVKADGYGLGAEQIVTALRDAGCRHFFVAYVQEALAIRDLVPDAMVGVLSGLIPGTEALYARHDMTPVLGSLDEVARWQPFGRQAILHVDTGMSRLGLSPREVTVLAEDRSRLGGMKIRYIMSHLSASDVPRDPTNAQQLQRFAAARAALPAAPCSLANSSGIFLGNAFLSDLARPGAALYGINPTPGQPNPMQRVVRLSVQVLAVREVSAGTAVGYNATWKAPRPSRIATVALGYADGLHRSLSGLGSAIFDGHPVPLVGRISMDLTTLDVTDQPMVQPGSWLEVLGPHLSLDDVAVAAGTNGYEVLTSLGRRFHRVYRTA